MPYDGTNFVEVIERQVVVDLRAVRKRIGREEDWCGTSLSGSRLKSDGSYALCLLNAMDVVTFPRMSDRGAVFEALTRAGGFGSGRVISAFNDSHTHAEVLALIDRAIVAELERAECVG